MVDETHEVRRSFYLRVVVALLGLAATFLTSVLAVRSLDARSATAFLAILGALMLGPMVGRLGLGQSAIRSIAASRSGDETAAHVVAHVRAVGLLTLLTAPLIAWLATAVVQERRGEIIALVVLLVLLETLRLTVSDIYAALGRIRWSVAATHHSRSVVALAALVAVVVLQQGQTTLITLLGVYAAVSAALLGATLLRLPVRPRLRGARWWSPMLAAMGAGAWLFTVELGAFLVGRGDVWLAGWVFPGGQALLYSTASVLAMQVTIIEGLANIALAPVAARLWAEDRRDRVFELLSASATVSTAFTMLAVVLAWFLAPAVLRIYGEDLAAGAPYLAVLATGGLGMAVCGSCAVLLVISGNGRAAAGAVALALGIVVPSAVLAARLLGPLALAVVSAASTLLLFGLYAITCRRVFGRAPLPGTHLRSSLLLLAGRRQ